MSTKLSQTDPLSQINTEVTFTKAFIAQISSQMIHLKKENLTYKEKIKTMKIIIAEGIRQNLDLQDLITQKKVQSEGRYASAIKYHVKHLPGGITELENRQEYQSNAKLRYESNPFGVANNENRSGRQQIDELQENLKIMPIDVIEKDQYDSRQEIEKLLIVLDRRDQEIERFKSENLQREKELNKVK
jgi:hypothetical protein